jgi:hypothetical protein
MNAAPLVSIVILDFQRQKEADLLLHSLKEYAPFDYEIVYVSNGGRQDYVKQYYEDGEIDRLVLCHENEGCGVGTRLGFHAALGKYVLYVQVDQFLCRELTQQHVDAIVTFLTSNPQCLYVDFAGDQGHGNFSERAFFIERLRYLSIPKLEETIGGPGPYANTPWTEELAQNYMRDNGLSFISAQPLYFADNGQNSIRTNPDGSIWMHYPDTKQLWLIQGPVKERYIYPRLNDTEWASVLETQSWEAGKIPEEEVKESFHVWH